MEPVLPQRLPLSPGHGKASILRDWAQSKRLCFRCRPSAVLTVVYLLLQRPPNNGPRVKVFDRHPVLPYHWQIADVEHWLLKTGLERISDSTPLTSSWSTHLSKAVWSLNVAVTKKGPFPIRYLLDNDQDKSGENQGFCPAMPGHHVSFFLFKAIPG